ncbi:FUSC family protein [Sphingomonas sp. NFR15]|uniref:FUSC family protein n=1 Tax=Sphingomonas sp. NFR15 TaxID=1566282 RepID=UPI00088B5FDC|nr:FUSC family protein [Sphingomonas sp. NFR15]SDA29375.1 Uncharacterized membrane protein YccC [Sphingomonas sp. NFR15]
MNDRYGFDVALFSLKSFIAAMLAYYIALRIGLTRPYWAVSTSYIVAQPLAGAVISKAVFRLMGTVLGATAAVVLVPNLVNAPELLSLALALWLGLCLFISLQDRTPRSYVFLLAGYTASIIGFPSVAAPGQVFQTSVLRVEEISLGILCGSLVHALVFPQSVAGRLLVRVDAIIADVERWSRDALTGAPTETVLRERRRLALDVNELHQLSTHLPFDTARFLPRVRTVRALQDQLSLLLPLASAVEDRIVELEAHGGVPDRLAGLIDRACAWLAAPATSFVERGVFVEALVAEIRAEEPPVTAPLAWRDALILSLASRLADLVQSHRAVRDLRDQIRSPSRAAVTPVVREALRSASKRTFHRDRPAALRAALGTVATMVIGCAFWIYSGWPDGAGAVLIAGVCCALFGNSDNPAPAIRTFLWGSIIGVVVAGIYLFGILPGVTDYVTVAAVLAPMFLMLGAFLAIPKYTLISLGVVLGLANLIGLNANYVGDFTAFANGAVAQLVGTAFAVVTVGLFQTVGAERSSARLIHAGWRDLARRSLLPGEPDEIGWVSKMLDRIGLLAPRLVARGQDPGRPLFDVLVDLRVGISVAGLRRVKLAADDFGRSIVDPVLTRVSEHYRARSLDRPTTHDPDLLAAIDTAMTAFAADPKPDERRDALLALTSLRRNLFPTAPGYAEAAA